MENNATLYHHGIKGQRWGVRRFQTKDGGLTSEGRKRYSLGETIHNYKVKKKRKEAAEKARLAKATKAEHEKKAIAGKVDLKDMTDDEIRKAIARKQLENAYNQLHPKQVSKGEAFVKGLMDGVIKPAAVNSGRQFLQNYLDKVGKEVLKDKADPNSYEALKSTYDKLKIKKDIADLKKPGKDDEMTKLEETYKKLDLQKKISDLEKPPKTIQEEIKELEDAIRLKKLQDEDYQSEKYMSERAEFQKKINKVKNNDNSSDDSDDEKKDEE